MKELELILQTVMQLGDAGKEAFIWWLVLDKGLGTLGWLLTAAAIVFVAVRLAAAVEASCEMSVTRLRDEMGVGYGSLINRHEYQEMIRWVRARKGAK